MWLTRSDVSARQTSETHRDSAKTGIERIISQFNEIILDLILIFIGLGFAHVCRLERLIGLDCLLVIIVQLLGRHSSVE